MRALLMKEKKAGGFVPGPNTYAYFPLKTDMVDQGPNHLATTAVGTNTIQSGGFLRTTGFKFNNMPSQKVFTMMARVRPGSNTNPLMVFFNFYEPSNNYKGWDFDLNEKVISMWSSNILPGYYRIEVMSGSGTNAKIKTSNSTQYTNYDKWNHFAVVMTETSCKIYINSVLSQTFTWSGDRTPYQGEMFIGCTRSGANPDHIDIGDIIYENGINWTQQEIAKYVASTASNYPN